MRAKEYIVANEATLKYPAEIRLQACLLQKELYEKNNALRTDKSEFEWIIPGITIPRYAE